MVPGANLISQICIETSFVTDCARWDLSQPDTSLTSEDVDTADLKEAKVLLDQLEPLKLLSAWMECIRLIARFI